MNGNSTSGFRKFGNKDLIDENDPFSRPVVRKRFQQTTQMEPRNESPDDNVLPSVSEGSPNPVFSPPMSLPESDGNAENNTSGSESDDEPVLSQGSTSSVTRKFAVSSLESKLDSTKVPEIEVTKSEKKSRPYEFDDEDDEVSESRQPVLKKSKPEDDAKFIPKKDKKSIVYKHKWSMNFDDDEEEETKKIYVNKLAVPSSAYVQPSSSRKIEPAVSAYHRKPIYSRPANGSGRVRNVKEAHEILEIGEHDDFKQDLEYILSTLKSKGTSNAKCLSAISLARKCVHSEFRQFCRSDGAINYIIKALVSAPEDELFALAAASVLYLLLRDFSTMKLDPSALRLFVQLLRVEKVDISDPEKKRFFDMIWNVFETYMSKNQVGGKKIGFSLTKEQLTPSILVLEALTFFTTRYSGDDRLKTELMQLGAIPWFVAKVDENVDKFIKTDLSASDFDLCRKYLDRCFRMLELCSQLHKGNQAFLISHRGSILIQKCSKFLFVLCDRLAGFEDDSVKTELLHGVAMMSRMLINLSHENELCCSKLGQIPGFIPACLTAFTYIAPRYAPVDQKFDLHVIMCSLLVNLVERCSANRNSLIGVKIKVFTEEQKTEEKDALEVLSKLFTFHEGKAKIMDEDLDKELAYEEPPDNEGEDSDDDEPETRNDGRLDRNKLEAAMGEEDMINAVQQAMEKATAHMEDSVIASYLALLIGCLLQQNEELADDVKKFMPSNSLTTMIEQLGRFLEFMKLATKQKNDSKNHGCRSIEKIMDLLDRIN